MKHLSSSYSWLRPDRYFDALLILYPVARTAARATLARLRHRAPRDPRPRMQHLAGSVLHGPSPARKT